MSFVRGFNPIQRTSWKVRTMVINVCALWALGCGGDEPTNPGPTTPTAPAFTITSRPIDAEGGGTCLEFYGVPQENVVLISVKVQPPAGDDATLQLNGATYAASAAVSLQELDRCYTLLTGTWTFTFTGNRPGGASFTAVATHNQT